MKLVILIAAVAAVAGWPSSSYQTAAATPSSIMSSGARCNGDVANASVDTAAALSLASAGRDIYIPSNRLCVFNAAISLRYKGQRIFGEDRSTSKIFVIPDYKDNSLQDLASGVINLLAPEQTVSDLSIIFYQPAGVKSRRDIISYPSAIKGYRPAASLARLLIAGATTCIDLASGENVGNSMLIDIETGCYDFGVKLDGALDTVVIRSHHHFPFLMDDAQASVFRRADNVAIDIGRADDFAISDGLCLGVTCISLHQGKLGGAFGTVVNYDFDGAAVGIKLTADGSFLQGSSLSFTSGSANEHPIVQTSGRLTLSSCLFFAGAQTTLDNFMGGTQTIIGSEWYLGPFDVASIVSSAPPENELYSKDPKLTLVGNTVERETRFSYRNAWVTSRGSERLIIASNSATPTHQKQSVFIEIANDTPGNRVNGNSSPGSVNILDGRAMPDELKPTQSGGRYYGN